MFSSNYKACCLLRLLSSINMSSSKLKRKRIKLECLECHSVFDDDYRKRHEQTCHQGKRVRVAHKGAPANPFQAAAANANKSKSIQSGEKVQSSEENAENQEYIRDAFCGKEGEDGKSINGSAYSLVLRRYRSFNNSCCVGHLPLGVCHGGVNPRSSFGTRNTRVIACYV